MVRIGIIGCGQIAQQHMQNYRAMPDVQLVMCADISEEAARRAQENFGFEAFTTDFRTLLQRDDIDAVDVCLHNNMHMPATVAVLESGKHAYCEKPMAGSYVDAQTMRDAALRTGRMLHIQLANIYADATQAAKELIDLGELGTLYHARSVGHRRRGRPFVDGYGTPTFVQKRFSSGGALYDMGVYHISQILFLLNNPKVARVSGKTYQKTPMDAGRRESSGYDVEEMGAGFVRFEGDITMDIVETWAAHMDTLGSSVVLGDQGGVRLDPFGFFRSVGNVDINATADTGAARFRWHNVRGDGAYYAGSQAHWVAALQGKVPLLPTAEIALNTMLISEAIYMSNDLGREVTAEEVKTASQTLAVAI